MKELTQLLAVVVCLVTLTCNNTQISEVDPFDFEHFISSADNCLLIVYTEGSSLYSTLFENLKSVIDSHPEFLEHFVFGKVNALTLKATYKSYIQTTIGADRTVLFYASIKGEARIPLFYCVSKECIIETIRNKIEALEPQKLPEDYTKILSGKKASIIIKEEELNRVNQSNYLEINNLIYECDVAVYFTSNNHPLLEGANAKIYSPNHSKLIHFHFDKIEFTCRFIQGLIAPTIIDINFAEFNYWLLHFRSTFSGLIFVEPENSQNVASSQLLSFSREADKYIEKYYEGLENLEGPLCNRFVFFKGKYSNIIIQSLLRKIKHDTNKPAIDKSLPMLMAFEEYEYKIGISVYFEGNSFKFEKPNYLETFIDSIIKEREIKVKRTYRVDRVGTVGSPKYEPKLYFTPNKTKNFIELNFNTLKQMIEDKDSDDDQLLKRAYIYLYRGKPQEEVSLYSL